MKISNIKKKSENLKILDFFETKSENLKMFEKISKSEKSRKFWKTKYTNMKNIENIEQKFQKRFRYRDKYLWSRFREIILITPSCIKNNFCDSPPPHYPIIWDLLCLNVRSSAKGQFSSCRKHMSWPMYQLIYIPVGCTSAVAWRVSTGRPMVFWLKKKTDVRHLAVLPYLIEFQKKNAPFFMVRLGSP